MAKKKGEKSKSKPKKQKKRFIFAFLITLIIGITILIIETERFSNYYLQLLGFIILAISIIGLFTTIRFLRTGLLQVIKSPYYLAKLIYLSAKKVKKEANEIKTDKKRQNIDAKYQGLGILNTYFGNFKKWEREIMEAESKIGLILGARGSGKTAFALKFLENIYSKTKKKCYAIGFKKEEMPAWIEVVESIGEIKNDSIILIDEGGVLFSSRRAMTTPNKLLSDLILISRHKNLTILFISQNSSNLDINIIRQADFLAYKQISLLQKDFERKKIKEVYEQVEKDFGKYKDDKGITYIYSNTFRGFIKNSLPSFWNVRISKSFR